MGLKRASYSEVSRGTPSEGIFTHMQPAVFIDRDDTLIANDGDLGDPAEVVLLDGASEAVTRLHEAGYLLVVVTNQGGVARGRYGENDVVAVHGRVHELLGAALPISFFFCPFHPRGTVERYTREHPWRKPAPGMLLEAAERLPIDLSRSWMIGDQERDAEAGRAAGCRTILLGRSAHDAVDFEARDITHAVEILLKEDA